MRDAAVPSYLTGVPAPPRDGNRFQERAPNRRALYAGVLSSFPTTFFTVEKTSEVEALCWNVYYGGSDMGVETVTFQVVTKAGVAVTLGTASIAFGGWIEFLTDAQPLMLGAEWGLRLDCTASASLSVVVSGIDRRLPQ